MLAPLDPANLNITRLGHAERVGRSIIQGDLGTFSVSLVIVHRPQSSQSGHELVDLSLFHLESRRFLRKVVARDDQPIRLHLCLEIGAQAEADRVTTTNVNSDTR